MSSGPARGPVYAGGGRAPGRAAQPSAVCAEEASRLCYGVRRWQAPRQEGARQGAQRREDRGDVEGPAERGRDLVPQHVLEAALQLEQGEALEDADVVADVLGDRVGDPADLLHAGGRVDGPDLVELLDQTLLDRLADAVLRPRERLRLVRGAVHGLPHAVREHRHEDRDAEQKAELAGRVQHARSGALVAAGDGAHAGGEQRRQREADAGSDEGAAPDHGARRGGAREVPQGDEPGGVTRAPVTASAAWPDTVGEPARGRREDHDGDREAWRSRARP